MLFNILKYLPLLYYKSRNEMETQEESPKEIFKFYQPVFKQYIKGKLVIALSKTLGCSLVSVYNYLGGQVPDNANCKLLVEEGLKVLDKFKQAGKLNEETILYLNQKQHG